MRKHISGALLLLGTAAVILSAVLGYRGLANHAIIDVDVIVIGAGVSGISAAHSLTTNMRAQSSPRVIVIEAQQRMGGRVHAEVINGSLQLQ